ncbi:Hypothetical predicted protein, partial [Scomber scombrus]
TDRVLHAALDGRYLIPGKPRRHEEAFLPPPALLCVCLLCPAQRYFNPPATDLTPAPPRLSAAL